MTKLSVILSAKHERIRNTLKENGLPQPLMRLRNDGGGRERIAACLAELTMTTRRLYRRLFFKIFFCGNFRIIYPTGRQRWKNEIIGFIQ